MSIFSSLFSGALSAIIGVTGDWVIAIALLTLAIRVVLFPLTIKQQRGMLMSQRLSEVKTLLDEKYDKKAETVSAELVKVMAKHRINPLSSLGLLVVQLPVFFSLYGSITHLTTSIGSVLIPWVASVAKADALHIMPVLAGVAQGALGFVGTPGQARNVLMAVLPIGLGLVFLWHAPVGLSVYWAVNALLGIAERGIFSVNGIRERFFTVPSAEEMLAEVA